MNNRLPLNLIIVSKIRDLKQVNQVISESCQVNFKSYGSLIGRIIEINEKKLEVEIILTFFR